MDTTLPPVAPPFQQQVIADHNHFSGAAANYQILSILQRRLHHRISPKMQAVVKTMRSRLKEHLPFGQKSKLEGRRDKVVD